MPFDATPISSPAIDRLRAGRALVARYNGWCQNVPYNGAQVCAVAAAGMGKPFFGQAARYLKIALIGREAPEMVENFRVIAAWNDVPGRQQHEVVALYDAAIAEAIEDQLVG